IPVPVKARGLFSAGSKHSLVGTSLDDAYSWGANPAGQLGNCTTLSTSTPVRVQSCINTASIAVGLGFSSGLKEGKVLAWGDNSAGQLGDDTNISRSTPADVPSLPGIISIANGDDFFVALQDTGWVFTWGDNSAGQLGDGANISRKTPARVPT